MEDTTSEAAFRQELLARLDILIALLLDNPGAEEVTSITAKILRLNALGVSQKQISGIVGKPGNYVSSVLAQDKKRKTKKRSDG